MTVSNQRWSDEEFKKERKKVLALWPTGKDVDLDEAVAFHKTLPLTKNYARVVAQAKSEGKTLVQPRGGVALVDEHIKLLRCLQEEGDADLLPCTTDTYTRNLKFHEAQNGIDASVKMGRSMLNGLPVVNHGVKNVRKVIESVDRPVIVLSGTIGMVIGKTLVLVALSEGDPGIVSGLVSTSPVIQLPLIWLVTRERPALGAWLGAVAAAAGTAAIVV